jgi:small subunit ribosomal protein S6
MAVSNYETVFIVEPEIPTDQIDQLINRIKETIGAHSGTVTGEDRWGRRRMAYPIQGFREGFYTVLNYTAEPTIIVALEHLFNVTDSVMRQLSIKVIKKTKKFAPRRERPAGATDAQRSSPHRSSGAARPKDSLAPVAAAAAPKAEPKTPAPAAPETGATA